MLKNAIDVGSRPYGQSVFDKKPAAIVTASPGSIGGFGANHQIRQACVFLNMPVMQQPEAYLGHVTDDSFDESGCLKDGPLKDLVTTLAHAFHDWVDMIHRSRQLLAEDAAHAAAEEPRNTPDTWRTLQLESASYRAPTGRRIGMEFTWLSRWQPQLLAILRIVVGLLFLEHGLSKFFAFPGAVPGVIRCRRCSLRPA